MMSNNIRFLTQDPLNKLRRPVSSQSGLQDLATQNWWIKFLPLLAFYLLITLIFGGNELQGDEIRYMRSAEFITQGHYVSEAFPAIHNAPGYPLFLAPFVALDAPLWLMRACNALFIFGAACYLFLTLRRYTPTRAAVVLTYLFGLFPVLLKFAPRLLTEPIGLLFMTGFIFHAVVYMKAAKISSKHGWYAGLHLGGLVLTKYIFFYVLIAALLAAGVYSLFKRRQEALRFGLVLALGLLLYSPYVAYNAMYVEPFTFTGHNGAEILYWRSTPYSEEAGNWVSFDVVTGEQATDALDQAAVQQLQERHLAFIEEVRHLPIAERNERLKAQAMENIKSNPVNFVKNTGASLLRSFFNFPYSYRVHKFQSYYYILPGAFQFVLTTFAVLIVILSYRSIPFEIIPVFGIGLVYLSSLAMLNGNVRFLLIISPILFLLYAYAWGRLDLQIKR